jgi:hypothetical protein
MSSMRQGVDLALINVDAGDAEACLRKANGQRQTDIPQTNHGDMGIVGSKALYCLVLQGCTILQG